MSKEDNNKDNTVESETVDDNNKEEDNKEEDQQSLKKQLTPVPKPDETEYKKQITDFKQNIDRIMDKLGDIKKIFEDSKNKNNNNDEFSKILTQKRGVSKDIRECLGQIKEKFNILKNNKDKRNKIFEQVKKMREDLKFRSVEDVDSKIKSLDKKIETESMSIKEEKDILKQIQLLGKSKSKIADYEVKQNELNSMSNSENKIIFNGIDELKKKVETLKKSEAVFNGKLDKLKAGRPNFDELKKQRAILFTEKEKFIKDRSKVDQLHKNKMYEYRQYIKVVKQEQWEKKREREKKA